MSGKGNKKKNKRTSTPKTGSPGSVSRKNDTNTEQAETAQNVTNDCHTVPTSEQRNEVFLAHFIADLKNIISHYEDTLSNQSEKSELKLGTFNEPRDELPNETNRNDTAEKMTLQEKLMKRNEELEILCAHYKEKNKELEKVEEEKKALTERVDKLNSEFEALQVRCTKFEENCSQLQKLNVEYKDKCQEINERTSNLVKENLELGKEIARLKESEKALIEKNKHNESLMSKNDRLSDELETVKTKNMELKKENGKLMNSLSAEMNNKLSRNESDVENVCIKSRPLKLQEEYELFCSDIWLEAKQALDELTERSHFLMEEKDRHKLLVDVMLQAYRAAENAYMHQQRRIGACLDEPFCFDIGSKEPLIQPVVNDAENQNIELDLAVNKYLKLHSDQIKCEDVAKTILQDVLKDVERMSLDEDAKSSPELIKYANHICKLAWKMCIQKPPMKFCAQGIGKTFNAEKHDLDFGSKAPGKDVKIMYYKYPVLYHGDKLMKKGIVSLG